MPALVTAATVKLLLSKALQTFGPLAMMYVREQLEQAPSPRVKMTFDSIAEFWSDPKRNVGLRGLVTMQGQLSTYAPLVVGSPRVKREAHRAYRLMLSERRGRAAPRLDVDAELAFTSGQMVWRVPADGEAGKSDLVCLGLYHSIVRNSVCVFVDRDYYYRAVEPKLAGRDAMSTAMEATVRGRLVPLHQLGLYELVDDEAVRSRMPPLVVGEAGETPHALVVDGDRTFIRREGRSRHLDGDIWVGVEDGGRERFVSRFLDVADPKEVAEQCAGLDADIKGRHPDGRVFATFDQQDHPIPGAGILGVEEMLALLQEPVAATGRRRKNGTRRRR